ncbi:MAG TPA: NfeD family protein, partial [Phycisphaerae bacterium]|nr:NfeD family protein [Phycisphaerae bacterium]
PAIPAYLWFSVRVLRETAAGRKLVLGKARPGAAEAVPEAALEDAMVGREGTTETVLRPTGAVRVDGKRVIALAEGNMIEKGVKVRVVRRSGMNVVVRPVEPAP